MPLALGMAAIGRPQYINLKNTSGNEKFDLKTFRAKGMVMLDQAYHLGVRHFDTAPGYGIAEDILIEWLKASKPTDVSASTKWGYTYVANFDPEAKVHEVKEHSVSKLMEQWEKSAQLLPYLTIYQIHSATLETGVLTNEPVLRFLMKIKNEFGLKLGISATSASQNQILQAALETHIDGESVFDVFQVTYNILDESLLEVLPAIKAQNKDLIIKEAMANGRIFPNNNFPHYEKLYSFLDQLAKKYQVGADAIALQFCATTIPNAIILSGAGLAGHLKQNLLFDTFRLTGGEIQTLKSFAQPAAQYWQERKQLAWN